MYQNSTEIDSTMNRLRHEVNKKMAEFNLVRKNYRKESEALEVIQDRIEDITAAQAICQQVAQDIQQRVHQQISAVVTKCLEAVFDEPYKFVIHFEQKRGRTEARLVFEREGLEVDPLSASGGGVVDVAAFALRISCLSLTRPPVRKALVMDEPFKFVSEDLRDRVRILLESLAEEMSMQFLMVTHIQELKTGTVVEL